jgi:HSP20 family protein
MARPSFPALWGRRPHALDLGESFSALQREVDRVFEDFRPFRLGRGGFAMTAPRLDLSETDGEYLIEAELPGVDIKDVEVSLDGDILTIKGEKKIDREDKTKDYHLVERAHGAFERSITLPFAVDPKKIKAKFDKGVLRITATKPAEAKTERQKIEIAAT